MLTTFSRFLIQGYESGLKRRKTFRYWRQLEQSQWLLADELQNMQLDALVRLLSHAARHASYYRDQWAQRALDPATISSLDDFQAWPVIDRETIRQHRMAMRAAEERGELIHKATGGSSGVPLQFDLDVDSNDRRMAAWHRGYGWAGAPPGTKQWYLWGGATGDVSAKQRWKDSLYFRIYRRQVANCFHLTEKNASDYVGQLNRYRPDSIVAYTNPLYTLARVIDRQGWRVFSPRSIVVGAEKIYDFQRELIERVFQAPVFETYGSREFMLIGAECDRHQGMHLTAENLLVEVLDDAGNPTPPGEEGDMVITDLTNYGMPFVRYRNGDRAIAGWETCSCGRGLPLLQKVVGRRLDMLETPDGRQIPGEFFPHLMKDYPDVRRFQVVQHCPEQINLLIVVGSAWTEAAEQHLTRQIRDVVGDVVQFELRRVDEIPLTAAGKLRVVVNHWASERQNQPQSEFP